MRVELLYFGVLKELAGGVGEAVELPEGAVVEELLSVLRDRSSNQGMNDAVWKSLAVAVNREYAGAGVVLREGDEVALLPPVSGGSSAPGYSAYGGRARGARKGVSSDVQWGERDAG